MPLSYDIKVDGGAVGDGIFTTAALTISAASHNLSSSTNLWVSGDVGKVLVIDRIGPASLGVDTTITGFTDAQHITIADAATTALSADSTQLCWGTDDSLAFKSFHTAAIAASGLVTLTIPSGIYLNGSTTPNDYRWSRGIPQLKVIGQSNPLLAGSLWVGGITFPHSNACSARIASASPTALSLQLLDVADAFKFQPGRTLTASDGTVYTSGTTCYLAGIDLQGFGDPNPFYFEWATITNVNVSTGVITLSAPIAHQYLSTWPMYNAGNAFAPDCGGPATIYMLDAGWDATIDFNGIRFFCPPVAINGAVRNISFTSCKWIPSFLALGPDPNNAATFTMDGCDFTGCFIEIDKIIGTINILNGSTGGTLWFQSASTDLLNGSNSTFKIQGTPKRTTLLNCTVATSEIGTEAYGRTDSFAATNCVLPTITATGVTDTLVNTSGDFSCVNGLITATAGPVRWAVPGTHVMFQAQQVNETMFIDNTLTGNGSPTVAATQTYIQTNIPGTTWPNVPLQGGTRLDVMAHPCPVLTLINCSGSADAIDLSNPGAQGKPIYSYSKRTYDAAGSGNNIALVNPVAGPILWGSLVSVKVTVGTAFTTSGSLNLKLFAPFGAPALDNPTNPNGSFTSWNLTIDLKTPGIRIITPTLVSGSAGLDSLSAPGPLWFCARTVPVVSAVVSGGDPGTIEIELITDQGFGVTALFANVFRPGRSHSSIVQGRRIIH